MYELGITNYVYQYQFYYKAFLSVIQPTTTGRKSKASKDTMTASYL